ncbi:MAG: trimeric intracellular cation channel family protein [Pseudomonadota bacterium]
MTLTFILEMLGTAAFAVSGALAAARKGMDIFGFLVLALLPAVAGGTLRDLILDRVPVFWVADVRYVSVAMIAAVIVYVTSYEPGGRRQVLIWMDAMGLALFAALGAQVSLQHGAGALVAVMLGVTTAVAGGMIRDVICNEIPLILRGEIYATAAFVASAVLVLCVRLGLGAQVALALAVLFGFGVRASAIAFGWSLPQARRSKTRL